MSKNKGGIFFASLLGAAAGVIGGLLLAPQSGKATRRDIIRLANELSKDIKTGVGETKERAEEIYGKATDEAIAKYNEVKNSVIAKVATLKTAGTTIDREKYAKVVDEVVTEFKEDFIDTKSGAVKIASYLKKDWDKVKKALA
jgi:gas vesicle protein